MLEAQRMTVLGSLDEDVAFAANVADERHDHLFADRVNGRVGDLREELFEVIEQRLRLLRETGERGCRCPWSRWALRRRWPWGSCENFEVLIGVAEGALALDHGARVGAADTLRLGKLIELNLVISQPFAVGLPGGEGLLEFLVGDDAAFDGVGEEHLAGLEAAFEFDVFGFDREHAGLRGEGRSGRVVIGDEVTSGTEAVAVEGGADHPAIGERQGTEAGPVPRLHQRAVIFVKSPPFRDSYSGCWTTLRVMSMAISHGAANGRRGTRGVRGRYRKSPSRCRWAGRWGKSFLMSSPKRGDVGKDVLSGVHPVGVTRSDAVLISPLWAM